MDYKFTTTDEQETGLDAARMRNEEYADKSNQEYLDYVFGSMCDSYVSQDKDEKAKAFMDKYRDGDGAAVSAVEAAMPSIRV